jgi:hypothetical protein
MRNLILTFLKMFARGDVVRVIDPGWTYSTYEAMFKELNFKNLRKNPSFKKNTIAIILDIHLAMYKILDPITEKESLINAEGIELYKNNNLWWY